MTYGYRKPHERMIPATPLPPKVKLPAIPDTRFPWGTVTSFVGACFVAALGGFQLSQALEERERREKAKELTNNQGKSL